MAHVVRTVLTTWTPEEAFAYMADFSHCPEWDPGVVAATRADTGAIGVGSAFDLTVRIGPRRVPLRYSVTEFSPGQVTFTARSAALESTDTVTVSATGTSTEVRYEANLHLRGPLRLADPLLGLAFKGVADRAIRGLERRLGEAA